MSDDHLQRLLLEQANVRCVVAHLDSVQAEVLRRGRYPDALARLLGESLLGFWRLLLLYMCVYVSTRTLLPA